jgi:hypothetical protein
VCFSSKPAKKRLNHYGLAGHKTVCSAQKRRTARAPNAHSGRSIGSPGLKSDILRRNSPPKTAATSCINAYLSSHARLFYHSTPAITSVFLRFFKKSRFVCHFMIAGLVFPAQSRFIDVFCGIFHIRGAYRRAAGFSGIHLYIQPRPAAQGIRPLPAHYCLVFLRFE